MRSVTVQSLSLVLGLAGGSVFSLAANGAGLTTSERAKVDAMSSAELMSAVAALDAGLASDFARLSNIEAMATVCGWRNVGFATKRGARVAAIKTTCDKAIAERFYADILAKDVASYRKDDPKDLCTSDNKDSVIRILDEM